jgi:HrpA-like RNA helicase
LHTHTGRTFPVEKYFLEDVVEMIGYVLDDDSEYAKWEDGSDGGSAAAHHQHRQEQLCSTGAGGGGGSGDEAGTSGGGGAGDSCTYSDNTIDVLDRLDHTKINYELIEQLVIKIDTELQRAQHLGGRRDNSVGSTSRRGSGNCGSGSTDDDGFEEAGSVLVFLPGLAEITRLYTALMSNPYFYKSGE